LRLFKEQGLLALPYVEVLEPDIAKREDLLRVHDQNYVDLIFDFAKKSRPYDLDTPLSPRVLEAALYIMGGGLRLGDALSNGEITRGVSLGGGLHHAGESYGGGFCVFNDVAILARFLQERQRFQRILILDYDVHAGNGTSDIFYSDPSVLFMSIHQDPKTLFPGTGFVEQIGRGEGKGHNVNLPLPPGTGDATYLSALREIFVPLAKEFKPDIILANGGSDPHFADILGSLSLTVEAFFDLSKVIADVAKNVTSNRLVLLVGSGYNPRVLPRCWYALAAGAAGLDDINVADEEEPPVEPPWCLERVKATLKELRQVLRDYWKCFN
jgi:acetoin utilization protein AcuC